MLKTRAYLILLCLSTLQVFADLPFMPIQFSLSTQKETYFEGEKVTFNIIVTNTDKEKAHPVLIPHTQNVGQKLFYLNLYDQANNTLILRGTEERQLNMKVQDTGSVKMIYLKPLEQITIPIYLNDSENEEDYFTKNSSHHSFGLPLFAGIYKVNVCYNPMGLQLSDSIYSYLNNFDSATVLPGKLAMYENGITSNFTPLKVMRSGDTLVSIERKKYHVKYEGGLYFYNLQYQTRIVTDTSCIHITSLPANAYSLPHGEYFYNYFHGQFAEYVLRFDDGDIREYRKFKNDCPTHIHEEKYNDLKQLTSLSRRLPDHCYYTVDYQQPGNRILQETYIDEDGKKGSTITYIYRKDGRLRKKKTINYSPCVAILLEAD
jgi:hypothetical protein